MLIGSSVLVGAVAATTTTAGASTGGDAWLKVCKTWTASTAVPGLTVDNNAAPFWFNVTGPNDFSTSIWSEAGSCSSPIEVTSGDTYIVSEVVEPWYQETAIGPGPATPASDLSFDSTLLPGYARSL